MFGKSNVGGGKKSGQYVWKRGNYIPERNYTITFSKINATKLQVIANGISFDEIDLSMFSNRVISKINGDYPIKFDETGTKLNRWGQYSNSIQYGANVTYDKTTGIITLDNYMVINGYDTYLTLSYHDDSQFAIVNFIVDDNPTAYPDGAVHTDGYYYELLGQVT